MFDRFILASNYRRIRERFNMCYISDEESYIPSYNISVGQYAYVVTNYQTKKIHRFSFGLSGISKEPISFVRAEGDRNPNDNHGYTGSNAIFLKPEFRNLIRQQRCLVLADAFVVGINKTPYLIHLRGGNRPFAFAGIWNKQIDDTGKDLFSFAIVTTTANKLLREFGYKRMPVILYPEYEGRWLRQKTPLSEVLDMLNPYPDNYMNAYPISRNIVDKGLNDKSLVQPIGRKVLTKALSKSSKIDFRKEVITDFAVVTALVDKIRMSNN